MKKLLLTGLLILLVSAAFADTAYRDQCRQVIYAVQPVEAISKVDDGTLRTLTRFAMGLSLQDQEPLSESDSYLFMWLANTETARRSNSPDQFSLFLQERREMNEPYLKNFEKNAITIDTWIDLFRIKLMFSN